MSKRRYQLGFGVIGVLIVVVAVTAVGGIGFVIFKKASDSKITTTASSQPTKKEPSSKTTEQSKQQAQTSEKQYVNKEYGVSFSYPSEWRLEERDPATSSLEYYNTVLSVWLLNTAAKPETVAATFAIGLRDLESTVAVIDGNIASHSRKETNYKQIQSFKGKETVKYTIPQSDTVNRIMYYIGANQKTYAIQTNNEEDNIRYTPDYTTKFSKMVNSLTLPH